MNKTAELLLSLSDEIVSEVVARDFALHPGLSTRYGPTGRDKALQDATHHVSFLAQALATEDDSAFLEYVGWVKIVLGQRHVRTEDFVLHLGLLADVLRERVPGQSGHTAAQVVTAAIEAIDEMPDDAPSLLVDDAPLADLAREFSAALLRGDRATASKLVLGAVTAGTPVRDVYLHVFQTSQYEIGRLWQTNRINVAQEHYVTAATQLIMAQLYEHVFATPKTGPSMVATSVAGNLHELGVRMVADFFEMDGWDTYYLGADTPHDSVIEALVERNAVILAVSASLPRQIEDVRELISAVRNEPRCKNVQILVGGHPFNRNDELWRNVGADGSAQTAQQAISLASELVGAAS